MSIFRVLQRFLFDSDTQYNNKPSRSRKAPRSKHIIVKHKGRQKRYRTNRYGEIFEE